MWYVPGKGSMTKQGRAFSPAKRAVGMILKDWEQIWKVTASKWVAAMMTSTYKCHSPGSV